jgi:hypothetical protein
MVLAVRLGPLVYKIDQGLLVKVSYCLVAPPLAVSFCHINGFCSNIGEFVAQPTLNPVNKKARLSHREPGLTKALLLLTYLFR